MLLVFLTSLLTFTVFAHQSSLTSGGNELFWSNPSVPIAIRTNTSDLSSSSASSIIQSSMSQWNLSSRAQVSSAGSSKNEIRFLSDFPYGSGVVGITEVSYNTSGAIQKAVISLNDDFYFHSTPGLYPYGQVFLGDVVTHELGHLFGMSHSEVLSSSMFYSSFSGQSSVSLDDKSGIRQKYDTRFGSITGYMKGGNNIGVLGAHVQAISLKTGEASGAISDENGYFELGGLDLNDTYYLYSSPIKNTNSLPGYFSNMQDEFCPATYVGSFFNACGRENEGNAIGITLTDNLPQVDVGTVTINCSLKSSETYNVEKLKTTITTDTSYSKTVAELASNPCGGVVDNSYVVQSAFNPVTIFDYTIDQKPEKAFVGWFRKSTTTAWSLSDLLRVDLSSYSSLSPTKYLKVSLISYPFGNQLEYEMTVKKNGSFVAGASKIKSYSSTTETFQTDFSSLIPLSASRALNTFEISVRSRKLSSSCIAETFPSPDVFTTESHLPYLIVASIWESTSAGLVPLLESSVNQSDNMACLDAPFTYAVAKALDIDDSTSQNSDQVAAAAGCGTIEPPNSGPGSSLPLMTAGFFLTLLASTLFKSRKKFLS